MTAVMRAEASAVAVMAAPLSMPASARIEGFTARMYDIAANVVSPATSSRELVELFSRSLNQRSNTARIAVRRCRRRHSQATSFAGRKTVARPRSGRRDKRIRRACGLLLHLRRGVVRSLRRLLSTRSAEAINDARLGQIVGRHFQLYAIARRKADESLTHAT